MRHAMWRGENFDPQIWTWETRQSKRRCEENVKMSLKGGGLYLYHVLINYDKTKNSATPAGFLYFDDW